MARAHIEDDIQKGVVTHLQIRGARGLVFFHVPNAPRSPQTGARLKAMGMRAGVSDLILVHNEKIYALELKAPGRRATVEQMQFLTEMGEQGAFTGICDSIDTALRLLESWKLIVGKLA